jgi:hypothetical protein
MIALQDFAGGLSVLCLAVWFALTCASQLPNLVAQWVRQNDAFAIVPRWNFFSPLPATHDFHLLYRDQVAGSLAPWKELFLEPPRTATAALWNPGKRIRKVVYDLVVGLSASGLEPTRAAVTPRIQTTIPYLALLNVVSHLPRSPLSQSTQFMIISTYPPWSGQDPEVLFVSKLHPL